MDERALDDAIDGAFEQAITFLTDLVAADSSLGRESAALEIFARELTHLGFATQRVPFEADLGADPRAGGVQEVPGERYNVLATTGGTRGPALLLHGHMDVVPATNAELWATPPFQPTRVDGRLFGRGAGDMKCGFAMGVLALRALREVEPTTGEWSLSFLAAIEEECTGNGTLTAARQGHLADAVVALEPTDLGLLLGGVGILWLDVTTVGRTAHAESAHLAVNPFDLLWRVIEALREWTGRLNAEVADPMLEGAESPYNLNIGQISGGDWHSSVPATATGRLRIAFPRAWTPQEAERRVLDLIDGLAAEHSFPETPAVRFSGLRAPGYYLSPDHPLPQLLSDTHLKTLGERPPAFALGSTTDARTYVQYFDTPALCYGPAASNIHGIDESVDLDSIRNGARVLARFLHAWFAEEAR